jgi:biotin carboxyl carrier protein
MEYELVIDGEIHKISIESKEGKYEVDLQDHKVEVSCETITHNCLSIIVDNKIYTVYIAESDGKKFVFVEGEQFLIQEAEKVKEKRFTLEGVGIEGGKIVCAPMPGKILKILVSEGEKVRKKQSLAIVEAMKMEHEIKSSIDGFVKKINFKEEDMVDTEEPIVELEEEK